MSDEDDARGAERFYRAKIAADPTAVEVRILLSRLLEKQGDQDGAIEEYRAAVMLRLLDPAMQFRLGRMLERTDVAASEEAYRAAIALDTTNNVQYYLALGNAMWHRDHRDQAIAVYRRACKAEETHERAHDEQRRIRAHVHFKLGLSLRSTDVCGAERAFRAAVEMDPTHTDALVSLGLLLKRKRGSVQDAEAKFRAALKIDPCHDIAQVALSRLLRTEYEDVDGSEEVLRKALDTNPKCPHARYQLGRLLEIDRLDLQGATAAYADAVRVDPTFSQARKALRRIS